MLTSRCPHCGSALGGGCTCVRGEYRMQEPETSTFFSNKAFNTITQICNSVDASCTKYKYAYVHDMYFKDLSREDFKKLITNFTIVDFNKLTIIDSVEMVPYKEGFIRAINPIGLWTNQLEIFNSYTNPKLYKSYNQACLDLLETCTSKRRYFIQKRKNMDRKIRSLSKKIAGAETL